MPANCFVPGCKSVANRDDVKFFRVPVINTRSHEEMTLSQVRHQAWITALQANSLPNKHSRVCGLHFISGKASTLKDVTNPDWVPTKNIRKQDQIDVVPITVNNGACVSNEIHVSPDESSKIVSEIESELVHSMDELSFCHSVETQTENVVTSVGTQTEKMVSSVGVQKDIEGITVSTQTEDKYTGLSAEILFSYEQQIQLLNEMLSIHNVNIENFKDDDNKTCFFTGISKFVTMELLFKNLKEFLPECAKLTKFQLFFITLSHLRLNLSFRYLSYQFNVVVSTISKYFHETLFVMYSKMRSLIYWPERESLQKTMPSAFQKNFGNSITVIFDCFEIFIQKSSLLLAASQTWSQYKHAYTVKYLIGISPQGFIQYISVAYGGRASDKYITETCGVLNQLHIGDVVMADRGFLIEDALKLQGVRLNIPAFTKGKAQLHPLELEDTRKIANVRIHVERVIGQLRLKFLILSQHKFPLSSLSKISNKCNATVMDQIMTVCCALVNMCDPICCSSTDSQ